MHGLIKGGEAKEYSGHMIPEGGYKSLPKLFANGLLVAGEAAGLNFNNGFILRGMDYAMASGLAAAGTVLRAKAAGDFSEKSLSMYRRELADSFVLKDMERFKELPDMLSIPRIYTAYPNLLCSLGREIFEVNGSRRRRLRSMINDVRRKEGSRVGLTRMGRDFLRIGSRI